MVKGNPCNPHVPPNPLSGVGGGHLRKTKKPLAPSPKKFYAFRSRTANLANRVKASTPAVITRDAPQAICCQSS